MPALPLGQAGRYVALAYVVLLTVLGLYLAIMAHKVKRAERRLTQLDDLVRERQR
jgi:heme exporter protein D